ncbi:MAG: hypothetical protein ACK2UK_18470 [Candidatus Promineifilaceae bacterium]|jgi:hypothetical protein
MRDLEVDHFGPWVIEISAADPPSPLFVPYLTRQEAPLLSLKIPRKIDTRSARPGMNLYDFLISLYDKDLVILQRMGDTAAEHTFLYGDIQFLRYGEKLLKGMVQIGLRDQTFELPFNTVSGNLMQRMVALIRERYCTAPHRLPALEGFPGHVQGLSYYFRGLLLKTDLGEPQLCLLAAQVNTPIASTEPHGLNSILYRAVGKILLESLHWSDGRELKIVTRGQDYKYKWQAHYAKETTYIPLQKITGYRWQSDTRHAAVTHLWIELPAEPLSFIFTVDNSFIPPYTRFLDAVSTPLSREEHLFPAPMA